MMRRTWGWLAMLVALAGVGACGNKGPLYLPGDAPERAESGATAPAQERE